MLQSIDVHFKSQTFSADEVLKELGSLVSPARKSKIEAVLSSRTLNVTPVLENLYDRGNISAVLRSAEALGYGSVHIIQENTEFKEANRVTQGADKWLECQRWASTSKCLEKLKSEGFRILVTDLNAERTIDQLAFSDRCAIVFGNERDGASPDAIRLADQTFSFPMSGFVQSFNISVAAALCLHHIRNDRIDRQGFHGDLDSFSKDRLRALYYLKSVDRSDQILRALKSVN